MENKNSLKVEFGHPHEAECEAIREAFKYRTLAQLNGELLLHGQWPAGTTAGNVLTGETYKPENFVCGIAVYYCPFCGKKLADPPGDSWEDSDWSYQGGSNSPTYEDENSMFF
jgi:hypothetical protein